MKIKILIIYLLCSAFLFENTYCQVAFATEVDLLVKSHPINQHRGAIVFAGSSTFRMWESMESDFEKFRVINHGFGGSTFADLNLHTQDLILNYNPKLVFIYEGDNDIASGKTIKEIRKDARKVISKILHHNPNTQIYLISPKPSPSRWNMKKQYRSLGDTFDLLAKKYKNVHHIDFWSDMLDEKGFVRHDLFIEDKLHMNKHGYDIWRKKIYAILSKH